MVLGYSISYYSSGYTLEELTQTLVIIYHALHKSIKVFGNIEIHGMVRISFYAPTLFNYDINFVDFR